MRAEGFTNTDAPTAIEWWTTLERDYGRDLKAESGGQKNPEASAHIGFFGATGLDYQDIQNSDENTRLPAWAARPCICTN